MRSCPIADICKESPYTWGLKNYAETWQRLWLKASGYVHQHLLHSRFGRLAMGSGVLYNTFTPRCFTRGNTPDCVSNGVFSFKYNTIFKCKVLTILSVQHFCASLFWSKSLSFSFYYLGLIGICSIAFAVIFLEASGFLFPARSKEPGKSAADRKA